METTEAVGQNSGLDTQAERALNFLQTLIRDMQMEATVTCSMGEDTEEGREVKYAIEGVDAARIIGKRGLVLEALQYLTTRVIHRTGEDRRHVVVDAEGYRARHEEQLAGMAQKLAERVASEGKVITFDPMNARDRRIVHMAVKGMPGVRTESQGEGQDRRVQILPENHPGGAPMPPSAARPPSDRGGDRGGARRGPRRGPPRGDRGPRN